MMLRDTLTLCTDVMELRYDATWYADVMYRRDGVALW